MKRVLIFIFSIMLSGILLSQENYECLLKARALIDNGKPGEALNILSGAISRSQESRLYLMRADAFMVSGNYANAISDYEAANRLMPASGEYGLSRISALKRDTRTSLYHLELNLSSSFKRRESDILLDPAFSVIENTPEWRLFWKREWYTVPEKKISEIEYYVSKGKKEDAGGILSELANDYPSDDQTLYAKALVDYGLQKYPESIAILTSLLSKQKNNTDYLRLLASAQYASGNMAGASSAFTRLIDLEYLDAEIFLKRADCYRKTQEHEKAYEDLEKYLTFYPESKEALSLSGKIESERGDNLKAIEFFSRNLKIHPGDPNCYIDRANAYFVSRTWDYAVMDYSMALDISPDFPEVWLNKGIAQLSLGKTEDACHDFRKALSLGNKKAAGYISRNCIK